MISLNRIHDIIYYSKLQDFRNVDENNKTIIITVKQRESKFLFIELYVKIYILFKIKIEYHPMIF